MRNFVAEIADVVFNGRPAVLNAAEMESEVLKKIVRMGVCHARVGDIMGQGNRPHLRVQHDMCPAQNKLCYDKRGAESARNRIQSRGGDRLRIYHCPDCNQWHLSKLKGKQ